MTTLHHSKHLYESYGKEDPQVFTKKADQLIPILEKEIYDLYVEKERVIQGIKNRYEAVKKLAYLNHRIVLAVLGMKEIYVDNLT